MAQELDANWELYRQLVERAWRDKAFKERLLADPKGTLAAEGVELRATWDIKIVEDTHEVKHFILPSKEIIIC